MFSFLLASLRSRSQRPRAPRRQPKTVSLVVERLDERCLLSTGLNPIMGAASAALIQGSAAPVGQQAPFHLFGAGQLDLATGDFTASGEATQLGHWTNSGHLDLVPVVVNGVSLIRATGFANFVAANGDTLSMSVDGFADPVT